MKRFRIWLALCLCIACAMATWRACAQADLFTLESAYIFNFAQFTRWPEDASRAGELIVCASSRSPLRDALAALNGRAVGALVWRFRVLGDRSAPADCRLLVLAGPDDMTPAVRDVVASDSPVLVVAEAGARMPGTIGIRLIEEDDHLRFDIDNTEAARRHLSLSSQLLKLARRVM